MNLRDEIRKRFTEQPPEVAEPGRKLEAALAEAQRAKSQLAEVRDDLAEAQRVKFRMVEERAQLQAQLAAVQAQLAETQAYIAELKRQRFGSKAEPLSAEQEAQLEQLAKDLQEHVLVASHGSGGKRP
jgi:chromosome segregation ATPase